MLPILVQLPGIPARSNATGRNRIDLIPSIGWACASGLPGSAPTHYMSEPRESVLFLMRGRMALEQTMRPAGRTRWRAMDDNGLSDARNACMARCARTRLSFSLSLESGLLDESNSPLFPWNYLHRRPSVGSSSRRFAVRPCAVRPCADGAF